MTQLIHSGVTRLGGNFSVFSLLAQATRLRRQRNALALLDAERLHDLGLNQADVTLETTRPFWDVPAHWRG